MNIQETVFANGLRLVMIPQPQAATATVLVMVKAGSNNEVESEQGISHFLEHVCFKGTQRRPTAQSISETFDAVGALYNAFTDHECTGYYAKGGPEHVPLFIDVLSDIYCNSLFDEKELEKEKGVILEEINMYEDMPQHKVSEQLYKTMFAHQPAGRSILGTKSSVRSFTREQVVAYRAKQYTASNTVIIVSGACIPSEIIPQIENSFASVEQKESPKKEPTQHTITSFTQSVVFKKTDQAHIALSFPSYAASHDNVTALGVLGVVLGGGMSSRLFTTLREEMGVAYYVRCDHDSYSDHGIFGISAGVAVDRINEVYATIAKMLRSLKEEGITEQELQKAKAQIVGMMRLGLESSDDIAHFFGGQLMVREKYKTPEERIAAIQKITVEDITRVARDCIVGNRACLVVVGPYDETAVWEYDALANL